MSVRVRVHAHVRVRILLHDRVRVFVCDMTSNCAGTRTSVALIGSAMQSVKATSAKIKACRLDRGAALLITAVELANAFFDENSCAAFEAARGRNSCSDTFGFAVSILVKAKTIPAAFDKGVGPPHYKLLLCGLSIAVLAKAADECGGEMQVTMAAIEGSVKAVVAAMPRDTCSLLDAARRSAYMSLALEALGSSKFAKVADALFKQFPATPPKLKAGSLSLSSSAYADLRRCAAVLHYVVSLHHEMPDQVATRLKNYPRGDEELWFNFIERGTLCLIVLVGYGTYQAGKSVRFVLGLYRH